MKNISVYTLIISLFFISCNNTDKFGNKWFSLDSHLTINNDKTFEFERFNCISSSISKGRWEVINDTLILNSFDNKGCYFYENFKLKPLRKNDKYILVKTNKDCHPNQGYVNFKNEKFYLKDSILIYKTEINNDNPKLNTIYNFTRKSRYK